MKTWQPVDWVVVMITVSLCFGLLTGMVVRLFVGTSTDPATSARVATFIGSLVAIVSLYVGAKIGADKPRDGEG